MVNKEELEVLKLTGEEAEAKDLWLKVYNDKTKKDGLISIADIIETMLSVFAKSQNKEQEKGR